MCITKYVVGNVPRCLWNLLNLDWEILIFPLELTQNFSKTLDLKHRRELLEVKIFRQLNLSLMSNYIGAVSFRC